MAPQPGGIGDDGRRKNVISVIVAGCSTRVTAFRVSTGWKSNIGRRPGITTPKSGPLIHVFKVAGANWSNDGLMCSTRCQYCT